MRKIIFYVLVISVNVNCRGTKPQTVRYDCKLFERNFEELIYVRNTTIEPTFKRYYEEIENGVFFINRFYGHSDLEKATVLKKESDGMTIIDLLKNKEAAIEKEDSQPFVALFERIEKGHYTQVCSDGPSEGSISLLLIKMDGAVVFKYEASQYDYTHLNDSERWKIKNALAIIDLLVGSSN